MSEQLNLIQSLAYREYPNREVEEAFKSYRDRESESELIDFKVAEPGDVPGYLVSSARPWCLRRRHSDRGSWDR